MMNDTKSICPRCLYELNLQDKSLPKSKHIEQLPFITCDRCGDTASGCEASLIDLQSLLAADKGSIR